MIINSIPFWTIKDISEAGVDDRLLADAGLRRDGNRLRSIKDDSPVPMKRLEKSVNPMLAVVLFASLLQQG